MSPKIQDPHSFLSSLLSKKGKSDLYGVYLTGVSILAEASLDYGYESSNSDPDREIRSLFSREEEGWNRLLVETRMNTQELIYPISFHRRAEPVTVFFSSEGHDMSCMVFIPTLVHNEFPAEVVFFQAMLKTVAAFAGKIPTSIRFTLGAVSMEWDDLVERGHAKEVEVGF